MKTKVILFQLLVLAFLSASSQQAEMLKDINPGPDGSYIIHMTPLGNKAVFNATNSGSNFEPWITDGTEAGTFMLKDINPGVASGSSAGPMVVCHNEVYFSADDGVHGSELWKTDGTPEGTRMVIDLFPGSQGSHPGDLIVFNDTLFFNAFSPEYGDELWKTGGDSTSTWLVADIAPGTASSSPCYLFATDNWIYFARENSNGLYHSYGTPSNTGLLYQDVIIGQLDDAFFTLYAGAVYFRGTDVTGPDAKGTQLWRIINNEVQRVTEIVSAEADLDPMHLTVAGDKLFFIGEQYPYGEELWFYDGLAPQMLKDINPSGHGNLGGFITEYKGKLVFSAGEASTGVELWVSDGTPDGTILVSDIYPGMISSGVVSPVKIGDTLYFSADDGTGGEIWKLLSPDGLPSKFTDITNGGAWGPELARLGGRFIFSASDAVAGTELWKMNSPGLGTNPFEPDAGSLISPNPSGDFLQITLPCNFELPAELTIYDTRGREIASQTLVERNERLSPAGMNCGKGVFMLKVQNGIRTCSAKFVVVQ
jgi:ELWxxDGT repeat protein